MRHAAAVVFLAVFCGACRDDRLVPSLPPGFHVDTYAQRSASAVDVLWVVDDSGSMAPRQEALARNFQAFISLFREGRIDFRMGVATTDIFTRPGELVGEPRVLTPDTPDLERAFAGSVRVGTQGSAYEAGLEAASRVLERQRRENAPVLEARAACEAGCASEACRRACVAGHPVAFLRPEAWLYLAFVTDEDDRSPYDVRTYWRAFEQVKGIGNDGTVVASAIIGDVPANGCGAEPGARYAELVTLTGGELGSICDADFADALRTLATSAVGLRRTFALERTPRVESLRVRVRHPCGVAAESLRGCETVDREACKGQPAEALEVVCTPERGGADGWTYEPERRGVFFAGDSVPGPGSRVELEYVEEGAP
ncbi:VWA domain-containing protein [Pyxidicoccus fallax]|uniref:VWA domain-containing protein n=1 Tax=Pyxidicoccus fallax TaxID=394095 RepID=A0A848LN14_9BACT|nr:vWA domain-containing protein [Pyxidicoccus fallax]NMO19126.1 VWA domain-containing protein [Pyxidicoccus fallax]NPC82140.1 VWA domain-containing protein [Pyxidicoccus fallax]